MAMTVQAPGTAPSQGATPSAQPVAETEAPVSAAKIDPAPSTSAKPEPSPAAAPAPVHRAENAWQIRVR